MSDQLSKLLSRPGVVSAAALGAMSFLLGISVSFARGKELRSIGYDDSNLESPLTKACRAHTNHSEYAPVLMALMLYIDLKAKSDGKEVPRYMAAFMAAAVLGRVSMAYGLTAPKSLRRPHTLRRVGAMLTYLSGLALSVCAAII